jgi:signal transduction histidine kinase/ActR/RegA family two-component response regulator
MQTIPTCWRRVGVPVVASVLAALLTVSLQPALGPGRFLLFFAAVVVGAWFGGLRGGLLACSLGAVGHVCLLLPVLHVPQGHDPSNWLGLALFLVAGLSVSNLIEALHAARRQSQRLAQALHERVEEMEEMHRHKDEFLAILGHELRNPLAPMANALRVLDQRDDAATRAWARGVVGRQVNHLAQLVEELLDTSRVAHGKIALRKELLELGQLVRQTLDDRRADVQEAGLTLETDLPGTPLWVEGDRTRLAQVLGNLLQNALKFTDPGGRVLVRLVVGEGADGASGRRAVLSVRDTGIGIEPEMLAQVFQNYTQARRGLGRGHGLGLGLALVRSLVELHGGAVRAASDGPGRGTEVTFWLPLRPAPAAGAETVGPTSAPPPCARVLIIEDNRDAAESLRLLLALSGHEVAVAHTGPAGVELARRFRPDVVLCDLALPGLSGLEVARALRRDPATARLRLLALSGFGSDEDRRLSREAGFDGHLLKPVEVAELEKLLSCESASRPEGCCVLLPGR